MNYSEALSALKAGRRIARRSWIEPGKWVSWKPAEEVTAPDGRVFTQVAHALFWRPNKGTTEPWLPSFDAQAGDDWYDVDAEDAQDAQAAGGSPGT
ncbi:MW1434 family type I TA system toxin [Streptomyces sp. YIM 98790]|uniref:Thoeris anti-defense Tad2 family protein n=1 Tax=Streptomyces sp. YIM 98790 TaxID=2689077 RepID=UPI00140E30AF|nr:MW1434 family type I TA system toxin [Streptomyces sp. YIM 98790]